MSDPDPSPCGPATFWGPFTPYATLADLAACGCSGLNLEEGEGSDRPLVERMLASASRRVFEATGHQWWGCGTVTVRPCRTCSPGIPFGAVLPPAVAWPYPALPVGVLDGDGNPAFVNVWACGCATGDPCSCSSWPALVLPYGPARAVSVVTIDGEALEAEAYALSGDTLLRVDGEQWPTCNDRSLPAGEVGTWSVTYSLGVDGPPELAELVAGYACELARSCKGGECALGPGVRVVRRGNVEYEVVDTEYREKGLVGYGPLDDWLLLMRGGHTTEVPHLYRPRPLEVMP